MFCRSSARLRTVLSRFWNVRQQTHAKPEFDTIGKLALFRTENWYAILTDRCHVPPTRSPCGTWKLAVIGHKDGVVSRNSSTSVLQIQLSLFFTLRRIHMSKTAFITGITGQDGSYLAELLLEKGYTVHGLVRRASTFTTGRINHIYTDPHQSGTRLFLHYGDLTDGQSLTNLVLDLEPDEIYNLGAQSHVRVSFDQPAYTFQATGGGALNVLEAARQLNKKKLVKVYQASSSEMYGEVLETPQTEKTPFQPQSPYGCAKVFAFHQTVNYRKSYDMFAVNGILFNHESPRRGETFVTRKITRAATRIKLGLQKKLYLGNLAAKRDWGYAKDYVEGMWRMLQHSEPDDFVLATGRTQTVQEFADIVFALLGLDPKEYIEIDPKYFRPAEVDLLLGDCSKAKEKLGWTASTSLEELAKLMVDHDLALAREEAILAAARK